MIALVTGANQGIGAAVAIALAEAGADVCATYLRLDPHAHADDAAFPADYDRARAAPVDATLDAIRAAGARATAIEADLALEATVPPIFDTAERDLGPVDVVVHCASGWSADSFVPGTDRFGRAVARVSPATFDPQFSVDARATALLVAEFARRHVERNATWGRIVTFTSDGSNGFPGEVSYGAAKAALESLTLSAAHELAPYGITANVVHPPVTDTGWITDAVRAGADASGPFGRVATADEVADVVVFLTSSRSDRVTGQVLRLH